MYGYTVLDRNSGVEDDVGPYTVHYNVTHQRISKGHQSLSLLQTVTIDCVKVLDKCIWCDTLHSWSRAQGTTHHTQEHIMSYTIQETYIQTFTGRLVKAWNVVDSTGFVVDTFSLKRDAKDWLKASQG